MKQVECLFCGKLGKDLQTEVFTSTFCESDISEELFKARGRPSGIHYRVVRCQKCGLLYSDPILDSNDIHRLYAKGKIEYQVEESNITKTYLKYLNKNKKLLKQKSQALEIGCGRGFFLTALKKFGFKNVYGIDPSSYAKGLADDHIRPFIKIENFEQTKMDDYQSFDLICMFQTIEHLINPSVCLSKVYKMLQPGGMVYIISHNEQSCSAKIMGERSPIFDLQHVYLFNKRTIKKLLHKEGFIIKSVFSVWNRYSLPYWIHLLPFKNRLYDFSNITISKLNLKWNLTLPAGNLGVVAIKPKV